VLGKLTDMWGATACVGIVDPLGGEGPGRRLGTVRSSEQDHRKWLAGASAACFPDVDGSQPDAWRYLVEIKIDNSADVADYR
jgi:hypothetical protein